MVNFITFYRKSFRGKLFVVKAGGRVITDKTARTNLLENIRELSKDGIRILLVYGGGHAIDDALLATGRAPHKIDGRRITGKNDIPVIQNVLAGDLGFRIAESMATLGMQGAVLGMLPTGWCSVKRRPKKQGLVRYDGTIETVHRKNVEKTFAGLPFIACPCLCVDHDGHTLNINADGVAVAVAAGTKAAKLILLTDVDGVEVDGEKVSVLTASELEQRIADGTVTGGMRVKLESCIDALRSGVKRVHILNGFCKNALHDEVYTPSGTGTMIVRQREKNAYEREVFPNRKEKR